MRIWHQIMVARNRALEKKFSDLQIPVIANDVFLVIHLYEDSREYMEVKAILGDIEHNDWSGAAFFDEDFVDSVWLKLDPEYIQWYPKPDGDFGYRNITYDTDEYCDRCGIGKIQKAPFRIKGEQNWKRKDIFQLNWVFDEHFTSPEIWERVFKPFGIGKRDVLHHGKGHVLETVVQLVIETISPTPMIMGDFRVDMVCEECSRTKYAPRSMSYYPPFREPKSLAGLHAFKSQEWFGSGHEARKLVIISRDLYRAIRESKLKGVTFAPIENS